MELRAELRVEALVKLCIELLAKLPVEPLVERCVELPQSSARSSTKALHEAPLKLCTELHQSSARSSLKALRSDVNGPVRYRFGPVEPIIKSEPVHSILAGLFGLVQGFSVNQLTSRTRSGCM